MKHNAFNYEFSMRELRYFLFSKKVCPKCKSKMEKKKIYETVSGEYLNSKRSRSDDFIFNPNSKVKNYNYKFYCNQCEKEYTLQELAKEK